MALKFNCCFEMINKEEKSKKGVEPNKVDDLFNKKKIVIISSCNSCEMCEKCSKEKEKERVKAVTIKKKSAIIKVLNYFFFIFILLAQIISYLVIWLKISVRI